MNNNLMRKLLCQEFCMAEDVVLGLRKVLIDTAKGYSDLDKSKGGKGNKGVEFIILLKTELEDANK